MENANGQNYWHCRIDTSGRIVIPKPLREQKGLDCGHELIVGVENGAIVMRTYEEAMQQLQDAFCQDLDPNVSLVDELLAERRKEAELEARR